MKKLIIVAAFMLAFAAVAQQAVLAPSHRKLTPEEKAARAERIKQSFMRNQGGFAYDRRNQEGFIAVVNAQDKVSVEAFRKSVLRLGRTLKIEIRVSGGDPVTIGSADKAVAELKANLAVFVVNDPSLPPLLIATESRWGLVNVARHLGEKQDERVKKEVLRAICQLCGSGYSIGGASIMTPITRDEHLDYITQYELPFDQLGMMQSHLRSFGITTYVQTTYREACRLGWAPAPTNEWQRAIYEETKSQKERGPTNGIKIAPPTQRR